VLKRILAATFLLITTTVLAETPAQQTRAATETMGRYEQSTAVSEQIEYALTAEVREGEYEVFLPLVHSNSTPTGEPPAGAYYVSTDGDDANFGSIAQPWRTIQHAADTVASGDTVIVKTGTYNERVSLDKDNSVYTTFRAEGQVVTYGFDIRGDRYRVQGFVCTSAAYAAGVRVYGDHNEVVDNEIYHMERDGIYFFGRENLYKGNYVHDILAPTANQAAHVDCFQTWNSVEDATFEGNYCELSPGNAQITKFLMMERNSCSGPDDNAVRDIVFRNNVFASRNADQDWIPLQVGNNNCSAACPIEDVTVVNNTFIAYARVASMGVLARCTDDLEVHNNLFVDFGDSNHSYVTLDRDMGAYDISHNAVYKTDGDEPSGGPYPGDDIPAIWMRNPRLVDLAELDFHLAVDSPLIDSGLPLMGVVRDYDGVLRPQGLAHDIGAYEYVARYDLGAYER
jgi:hypothetical protein